MTNNNFEELNPPPAPSPLPPGRGGSFLPFTWSGTGGRRLTPIWQVIPVCCMAGPLSQSIRAEGGQVLGSGGARPSPGSSGSGGRCSDLPPVPRACPGRPARGWDPAPRVAAFPAWRAVCPALRRCWRPGAGKSAESAAFAARSAPGSGSGGGRVRTAGRGSGRAAAQMQRQQAQPACA